jgi:hypothetical protein
MDNTNRVLIVIAAAVWIVLMATVIFLTWNAPGQSVDALRDFVQFLDDNRTDAGRLILTLSAVATIILALLIIIMELAPEDEPKELRIEQAGATTIIPGEALRMRLEEALLALTEVMAAKTSVRTKDKGIAIAMDLTIAPAANAGHVTQEAIRVVVDAIQTDLGLPVAGMPTVKIAFGGPRPIPVASSVTRPPAPPAASAMPDNPPPVSQVETVDERVPGPPAVEEPQRSAGPSPYAPGPPPASETPPDTSPGASPGPMVYEPERRSGDEPAPPDSDDEPREPY